MKVFVIIVTYNAMKWVDRCFGSLRESHVPCVPVVVDNQSKDETVKYIREHYPEAYIIENNKNRGFGQANNQGIEYAYREGAQYFFLLNQDAWVHPDTLEKLVLAQEKTQAAIVSPMHLNARGDYMDDKFYSYSVERMHNNEMVSDFLLNKKKDFYEVKFVNAAAWMLPRNTIEVIGGFDPLFFHYGEDANYVQRILYNKMKIIIIPDAFVHHDRNVVGNQQMYKKNVIISRLLKAYADVNVSPFKPQWSRIKMHLWHMKMFIYYSSVDILRGGASKGIQILKDYLCFIGRIPCVIKSWKKNKNIDANWLNLVP